MISLLVSLTTQVFFPNPCLLIEEQYGEHVPYIKEGKEVFALRRVIVAVWPDGRIVWSRPVVGKPYGRDLRFFEAKISVSRVQAALSRIEEAKVFQFRDFFSVPFHASYTEVSIRIKG